MDHRIEDQLANTLGRRDEAPNIALAEHIADNESTEAINELLHLIETKKLAIKYDAIKVLYEVGARKPELINAHYKTFVDLLKHKDNRMQWGAMTALSVIGASQPSLLSKHLVEVVEAMDKGSVITRDHGIYILAHVGRLKKHHADCMELLLEQVEKSPVNQVPMYAEKTAEIITLPFVDRLAVVLKSRTDVLSIPSKKKRVEKLLKSLDAKF